MLTISAAGTKLIQNFESFSPTAYLDSVGVPTIGYGTTEYPGGHAVAMGDVCTQEQANEYMMHDLTVFEEAINKALIAAPNQNQFDAMTSLCYNIGVRNFLSSSVLRHFNEAQFEEAQHSFLLWNEVHENGQPCVLKGLTIRRAHEAALFGPLTYAELVKRYSLDV